MAGVVSSRSGRTLARRRANFTQNFDLLEKPLRQVLPHGKSVSVRQR
jgi:hypothetical protein